MKLFASFVYPFCKPATDKITSSEPHVTVKTLSVSRLQQVHAGGFFIYLGSQ
jgi:hypothetical protein